MNLGLPSNAIPWLIGFPVFLFFGFRGLANYRRLHNPLSQYFAWSGFSAAIAFMLWSVPFFLTSNENVLIAVNIIGDCFLYAMFVLQAVIVHYLTLKARVSVWVLLLPTLLVAISGVIAHAYGYVSNGVEIVGNEFIYELPLYASVAQGILLVNVFLVAILLLMRINQQNNTRGKGAILGISLLYLLSGVAGTINILSSGTSNESPIIIASYIGAFVLFGLFIFAVRLLKPQH